MTSENCGKIYILPPSHAWKFSYQHTNTWVEEPPMQKDITGTDHLGGHSAMISQKGMFIVVSNFFHSYFQSLINFCQQQAENWQFLATTNCVQLKNKLLLLPMKRSLDSSLFCTPNVTAFTACLSPSLGIVKVLFTMTLVPALLPRSGFCLKSCLIRAGYCSRAKHFTRIKFRLNTEAFPH